MTQIPMFDKVKLSPRSGLWVCTLYLGLEDGPKGYVGTISLAVKP